MVFHYTVRMSSDLFRAPGMRSTTVELRNTLQLCPNGAASSSPGLARAAGLPWVGALRLCTTPKGLWRRVRFPWLNPVGVGRSVARVPKVAASRQPWALGLSPVGAGSRRRRTEREHPEVSISLNSLAVGMRSERSALGRLSGFARFYISRTQALSHGVASESSPRRKPWEVARWRRSPGRGDRNKAINSFAAPRLLPFNADPHSWRRGLLSGAARQLTAWTPLPKKMRPARWRCDGVP